MNPLQEFLSSLAIFGLVSLVAGSFVLFLLFFWNMLDVLYYSHERTRRKFFQIVLFWLAFTLSSSIALTIFRLMTAER